MKKLQRIFSNVLTFRNVFSIYGSRFFGVTVQYLYLWEGSVFKVINANNNLGTVVEVFHKKEYRDVEELQNTPQPILIDIGANIGTFSVWALRTLPSARVFSYEPEQKNYELLIENLRLNKLVERASPFKYAVCGEKGQRSLSIAGESSGKNSVSFAVGTGDTETVECVTLDSIFSDNTITHCDCLKVDCEGAEYELLYKASEETLAKITMIILEYHTVAGENPEELKNFLRKHGFTIVASELIDGMFTARREAVVPT